MARTFNGSNTFLYVPPSQTVRQGAAITCAAWIYPTSLASNGQNFVGCDESNNPPYARVFQWRLTSAGAVQAICFHDDSTVNTAESASTLSTDEWAFVAFTFDGSLGADNINVFVDSGSSDGAADISGDLNQDEVGVTIGARSRNADASAVTAYFSGRIAEAAQWSRVLSSGELGALARGYAPSFFHRDLAWYFPLLGDNDPEIDRYGGMEANASATAPAKSAHPRIVRPSGLIVPGRARGASAATAHWYYGRRRAN